MNYFILILIFATIGFIVFFVGGKASSFDKLARKKGYIKKTEVNQLIELITQKAEDLIKLNQLKSSLAEKEYTKVGNSFNAPIENENLSVQEQIEKLKSLFSCGEISPSEYESKLNKLLDKL